MPMPLAATSFNAAAASLNSLPPTISRNHMASGIPGMPIIGGTSQSSLPLIQVPSRKSLTHSLPQGYHSYKSQSESPFAMRGGSKTTKHSYASSAVNTIKLDKIEETTFKNRNSTNPTVGGNTSNHTLGKNKNRSISPKSGAKQTPTSNKTFKNTVALNQNQRPPAQPQQQRPIRLANNTSPTEKLSKTVNLTKLRPIANENSGANSAPRPFLSHHMWKSAYTSSSSSSSSNSNSNNSGSMTQSALAVIPEQQTKPLSQNTQHASLKQQSLSSNSQSNQSLKGGYQSSSATKLDSNSNNNSTFDMKLIASKKQIFPSTSNSSQSTHHSNNQSVPVNPPEPQQQQQPYKFYVGGGNNGTRIKKLLLKRDWVEQPDSTSLFINFKWQQSTRGYKYDKLVENGMVRQAVNHFEHHKEISNKQYLVKNLTAFAESMKQNVFDITPLTYVIDFHDENCDLVLNNFLKFFEMNTPIHLKKRQAAATAAAAAAVAAQQGTSSTSSSSSTNNNSSSVSAFPPYNKVSEIRRILRQYQLKAQIGGAGQSGTEKLFNYFYTRWSLQDTFLDHKNESSYMWLLKPTFLNRGRGIHVFNNLPALEKLIIDYTEGFEEKSLRQLNKELSSVGASAAAAGDDTTESYNKDNTTGTITKSSSSSDDKPKSSSNIQLPKLSSSISQKKPSSSTSPSALSKILSKKEPDNKSSKPPVATTTTGPCILKASQFVVQKYIEKPLLINKRKFDIRVWAMVSHNLDVFFFREGYMRLSSSEFSTDEKELDNLFIHLTNNAIQKYSDSYGSFENGNMWSFTQLWEFLEANQSGVSDEQAERKSAKQYKKQLTQKMKNIIMLTFSSVKKKLNANERKFQFEIFGFDFLLDEDLNTWLIEVNTNPAIEECSALMQTLIPRALDDAFKLTLDVIFPPKKIKSKEQPQSPVKSAPELSVENDSEPTANPKVEETTSGDNLESEEPEFYHVPGYEDAVNMWEQLGNLKDTSKEQTKKKFKLLK